MILWFAKDMPPPPPANIYTPRRGRFLHMSQITCALQSYITREEEYRLVCMVEGRSNKQESKKAEARKQESREQQ